MSAGKLRQWLTFQTLALDSDGQLVRDSDGQLVEDWVDAFDFGTRMPCEIENLSGRELLAAQALASRATHRITTRYRPGFSASQRAVHSNGTIYNIESVQVDNDSGIRWVRLLASSGLNAGGTAT